MLKARAGLVHEIPSGKLTKSYGKSQFLMGKSTISMGYFQVRKLFVYQAG